MQASQKVGGYIAIVQGILFVILLALLLVILPGQGFSIQRDYANPVKAAPVAPLLAVVSLVVLLVSLTIIPIVLAVYDRIQSGAPNRSRMAVIAATVASALFLAQALVGIVGGGQIIPANLSAGPAPSIALAAVTQGLLGAATVAAGWSGILWSWAALSTGALPKPLCYVVLLSGILEIINFAFPLGGLVGDLLVLVWSFWLGATLLREPSKMSAPAMSRS